MWEAIAANKRRSVVLIITMGALLISLGFAVGIYVHPRGGPMGALAAAGVWLLLWVVAHFQGDGILLATAGARKIEKADAPLLWNVVEEMTIASGLPKMPDVYVINDDTPNAFAVGRSPERCAVAATTGLLRRLHRDELQGVMAHEVGHVLNRDIFFLMLVGVMLGAIVLIAELFLRGMRHTGRRSSRDSGQGQAIILVVALVFVILAPILAQMIYFACSRRREYLADATSAQLTRYPAGLASALEKISSGNSERGKVNRVLAPMYIINPMSAMAAVGLFSTHPPTAKRVEVLRSMAGGADFARYEEAFRRANGGSHCIGEKTLAVTAPVTVRAPVSEPEKREETINRLRKVADISARMDHLVSFACACGVTIRIPAGLKRDVIPCVRCGVLNPVPSV